MMASAIKTTATIKSVSIIPPYPTIVSLSC
jgi:hypothetical protein